jgi:hypothetical protein
MFACHGVYVATYWIPIPEMVARHIDDDALEAYSLGRLAAVEPAEEHLLVCADCRERLAQWDEYVRAIRDACRQTRGLAKSAC